MTWLAQGIPFVHPGLAGMALLAGMIPILIHLINRRRYVRIPWAAMSFLLAARRHSARRLRLEHWLLLLARIAVMILVGLAAARPYLPASAIRPAALSRSHRILVLDNSLSMSAADQSGRTRFDVAQNYLERLVSSLPAADAVSIVVSSTPASPVVGQACYDDRLIREQLAALAPTQRGTDTAGGLDAALSIFRASGVAPQNRTIYLISDLPRTQWQAPTPGPFSPAVLAMRRVADAMSDSLVNLQVVHTGGGSENLAVTGLVCESNLLGVHSPVRIAAEVSNFGAGETRGVGLEFRRDGQILRRQELPAIPSKGVQDVSMTTEFSTPGTHTIEARLSLLRIDRLEVDNTRHLSVEVREQTRVLIVDGRPGATPLAGQAGFLATALSPRAAGGEDRRTGGAGRPFPIALIEPKVIAEAELADEVLADYAVVGLCNVGRMSAEQWRHLERYVSGGGGLLVFSGDLVQIENYNQFGHVDGTGVLPGRFAPSRVIGGTASEPTGSEAYVGFRSERFTHPIMSEFSGDSGSGLFRTRIHAYLPVEADRVRGEVVLRYTDGAAALLASTFGEGRVVVCTTTANMDWNNLPAKGDFVSVAVNIVAYLSPRAGGHRNVVVGERFLEPVAATAASLPSRITTSDGGQAEPSVVRFGDGLALQYGPVERAGVAVMSVGTETRHFAGNVDAAESDLSSVDEQEFRKLIDRPVHFVNGAGPPETPAAAKAGELSRAAWFAVLLLLVLETWMAVSFGSQRSGGQ